MTSSHPFTGGIPSRRQSRVGCPPKATFPPCWRYSGLRAPLRPFFRGLVRLPVTGLSARGNLAPSVRRHNGSTVVFSRVAAGRAIGLTAAVSVWCSGGKCGQARFLLTETPIQLQVSRLACHTIPCPMTNLRRRSPRTDQCARPHVEGGRNRVQGIEARRPIVVV